jgi:hypothetical protein
MARTSEQLTPSETLAVAELNAISNSKVAFKDSN